MGGIEVRYDDFSDLKFGIEHTRQINFGTMHISALGGSKVDAHYLPPALRPLPRATNFHLTYQCKYLLFEGWRAQVVAE